MASAPPLPIHVIDNISTLLLALLETGRKAWLVSYLEIIYYYENLSWSAKKGTGRSGRLPTFRKDIILLQYIAEAL